MTEENEEIYRDDSSKIRRMTLNKQERRLRKTNIWLTRLKRLIKLLMILALIFVGYKILKLPQWYLSPKAFNSYDNPSLEILNNDIVPSYHILAALRRTQVPACPIYLFETSEIKKNIMQLDPVQDVIIRRFWFPARLQINVIERIPAITIAPAPDVEPVAFFTKGGKLIGRDYLPLKSHHKTILVLSYEANADNYRHWNNEKIEKIEKLAKEIENLAGEKIEYIDLRNPKDVYIKMKSVNFRLGEIDGTVIDRISRIPSILPQVKTLDKKIKYVDLRWKDTNYIKLED